MTTPDKRKPGAKPEVKFPKTRIRSLSVAAERHHPRNHIGATIKAGLLLADLAAAVYFTGRTFDSSQNMVTRIEDGAIDTALLSVPVIAFYKSHVNADNHAARHKKTQTVLEGSRKRVAALTKDAQGTTRGLHFQVGKRRGFLGLKWGHGPKS